MVSVLVGSCYAARYPRHNIRGAKLRYENRRFRVLAVRDQSLEPIKSETIDSNPLLKRRGSLLTVWDFDKGAERSFYVGSLLDIRAIEPPKELTGWQIVSASTVVIPYTDSLECAKSCVNSFEGMSLSGRKATAVPIRLPNLAGNLYRETA